jgi:ribosomal protein S18 acetylase RimI-like enzyme
MLPDNNLVIELTTDPADYSACARMMAETDPWITLGMDYNYCLKAFEGLFKEVFVLKKQEEIIGFVIIQTQGTFKGYIQTICIDKTNRRGGYGTKILEFCEERILQYSPNIFICVSSFNEKALHLYQKFGFRLIGELQDFIKPGFTELLLRKTVGPIAGYQP